MILFIKFLVAFCSIAYELILAQSLTAFLENTVLRYSMTIGLYLFSMGLGAFFIGQKLLFPWKRLWKTEVALTIIGALSLPSLFLLDHVVASRLVFMLWAHGLIVLIGFLTGFELPLILEIAKAKKGLDRHVVIATDYAGAFFGTIVFVFFFYPTAGLVASGLWISLLNAFVGWQVLCLAKEKDRNSYAIQAVLVLAIVIGLFWAGRIENFLINHLYLG